MDVATLQRAPVRRPLSAHDRRTLAALECEALPTTLSQLAQWMGEHGEKGEQEAFL